MGSVELVGRVLLSLAVVLAIMWVIARRMRRGAGRGKNGRLIEVLSRQPLSRSASVAVVRVLDQALVVGVTDGQITVLAETDLAQAQGVLGTEPVRAPQSSSRLTSPDARRLDSQSAPKSLAPTSSRRTPLTSAQPRGALTGSALSPTTWRQSLDALRDLTARKT